MERSASLLCSFSGQLRWRMRGVVRRRTAPGRSVRCRGQRGCRCVHRRWHSPKGHGQIPTGKVCHLERNADTEKATTMCNDCTQNKRTLTSTHTYIQRGSIRCTEMQMKSCPGQALSCNEAIDQRTHRFHFSLRYVLQSRALRCTVMLVTSPAYLQKACR